MSPPKLRRARRTKGREGTIIEPVAAGNSILMNWTMAKEVGPLTYITRRLLWRARTHAATERIPYVLPGGQRIVLPKASPFASDIFCTRGQVDWGSEELLLAYLAQRKTKGCCYDVGANMGYYSVLLASVSPPVFAFEPDPRNHADLIAQEISSLTFVRKAVSDYCGTARFDVSSASTVGHLSANGDGTENIDVECITLDSFRETRPETECVAAIKMDIEGYELSALRGGSSLVQMDRPVLLIEFGIEEGRPNSFSGLGEFVAAHDYEICAMIRCQNGQFRFRTTLEMTSAPALASLEYKMLFLVPREEGFFKDRCAKGFCFERVERQA